MYEKQICQVYFSSLLCLVDRIEVALRSLTASPKPHSSNMKEYMYARLVCMYIVIMPFIIFSYLLCLYFLHICFRHGTDVVLFVWLLSALHLLLLLTLCQNLLLSTFLVIFYFSHSRVFLRAFSEARRAVICTFRVHFHKQTATGKKCLLWLKMIW